MRHSAISLSPPFDCLQDLAPKTGSAQLAATRVAPVILENGVIRTMDTSLPTARGLAIAGEWIAGGVGTHEIAGDTPVALMARDSHSVWLNSAALDRANGDLQVPGGVVELDEGGEPTGVLREESCWHFRDAYIETTDDEYMEAMRGAIKLANARGVTAVHDKDGWLRALRFWQRLDAERPLSIRVWQSLPAERADELGALGIDSGLGNPRLKLGYLK